VANRPLDDRPEWRPVAAEALRWRQEHGATLRELAVLLGVPRSTLSRWIRHLERESGTGRVATGVRFES